MVLSELIFSFNEVMIAQRAVGSSLKEIRIFGIIHEVVSSFFGGPF
jgi:hypothetical protein